MVYATKNRIRKRRYNLLKEEANKENLNNKNTKNKALSFLSSLCVLFSIALSVLIYGKTDENGKWLKENFGIEFSFNKVNEIMSKYTNYLLDFDIFTFFNKEEAVSYEPVYMCIGDDMFTSGSNSVVSIGNGTVIFVGSNNDEQIIIIQHDLGYTATYSGLADVLVSKYDRVDDKANIGICFEEVKITFEKNNGKISYEEVLGLLS